MPPSQGGDTGSNPVRTTLDFFVPFRIFIYMGRKKKNIHYLYKTTCLVTGRYYIGIHSTNDLEDGYMGSGRRLRASIRKHGEENHKKEILEFFETRELLIEAEKTAITEDMIGDPMCMNLMGGGTGGFISEEHYNKLKIKSSEYQKEKWKDLKYREKITSLSLERLIESHKKGKIKYDTFTGKKHTEETKKKMSEAKKGKGTGKNNSQYGTMWITKDGINKKIKKEELNTFISQGWEKGRKLK